MNVFTMKGTLSGRLVSVEAIIPKGKGGEREGEKMRERERKRE